MLAPWPGSDTVVFPFAMCWRHYVELQLKTLIPAARRLLDKPVVPGGGHNIKQLWSAARIRWLAEGALIFSALRLVRLLWVFRQVVLIATSPAPEPRRRDEPITIRRPA